MKTTEELIAELKKFKRATWEDIGAFWDKADLKTRLEYTTDGLNCLNTNSIAIVVANQKWSDIPDCLQEVLDGYSQLGNDVFDELNANVSLESELK